LSLVTLKISRFLKWFLLIVLRLRVMPHQGKKLMDIEFAMDLMVTYSVDKAYFGKGRSGFDPDFKHLYTHVITQRD
jgi:hypothetical protein